MSAATATTPQETRQGKKDQRGRGEAALEEVQKMTDEEIRRMEELSQKKEAEVMHV